MHFLREICKNCGCTLGSHLGCGYISAHYRRSFPTDCCPGHEGRMDWDKGPGTVFEPTGTYKEEKEEEDASTKNSK